MLAQAESMAESGLRVLAVARAGHDDPSGPDIQHDFGFEFVGLVGLADPLRPEVPQAVAECHAAGVRVRDDYRRPSGLPLARLLPKPASRPNGC